MTLARRARWFSTENEKRDYKLFCAYSLDHKNCTFGKRGVRNLLSKEIQARILAQAEGEYSPGEFTKTASMEEIILLTSVGCRRCCLEVQPQHSNSLLCLQHYNKE